MWQLLDWPDQGKGEGLHLVLSIEGQRGDSVWLSCMAAGFFCFLKR